jgi:two-component system response regulator
LKPLSVLLVEDNDADAELTSKALREVDPAVNIARVHDGSEAIDYVFREGVFRERPRGLPALILLDLQMPRVGGIDVLQSLRSDELTHAIPVLILTGSLDERDRNDAHQLGAAGYLAKPVTAEALRTYWPP